MTLIVNCNRSFFQTSATKILKYEQLKFSINVNNKKWLFHHQKKFQAILTKIQFSVIFGKFFSVLHDYLAGQSREQMGNMRNSSLVDKPIPSVHYQLKTQNLAQLPLSEPAMVWYFSVKKHKTSKVLVMTVYLHQISLSLNTMK